MKYKSKKSALKEVEKLTTDQELEKVRIATKLKNICTLNTLQELEKFVDSGRRKIA